MEAGSVIRFDVRTPVEDPGLFENVASCLTRRLPELRDFEYPRPGPVRIIANGPSARRARLDGVPTVALNGALKLFTEQGLAPTYWMVCDPQELVLKFLEQTPLQTQYLVASKCHPRVFDRLASRGCHVTVWHVDEEATRPLTEDLYPVPCASTITLTAFKVLERLGYRAFETWGWDACYGMGGDHHANDLGGEGSTVELDVGGRKFVTTAAMAMEAQEASAVLSEWPWPLEVRGGGLVSAVLAFQWAEAIRSVIGAHVTRAQA